MVRFLLVAMLAVGCGSSHETHNDDVKNELKTEDAALAGKTRQAPAEVEAEADTVDAPEAIETLSAPVSEGTSQPEEKVESMKLSSEIPAFSFTDMVFGRVGMVNAVTKIGGGSPVGNKMVYWHKAGSEENPYYLIRDTHGLSIPELFSLVTDFPAPTLEHEGRLVADRENGGVYVQRSAAWVKVAAE